MDKFIVSVIIPVYNAAKYVQQAVESAIHLKEVGEVIMIEDGSPDNALEVCKTLAKKYRNIILLRHKDGVNKGAGASRNLGIENSSFDYVAFLDADDWYLPNRFVKDVEIFSSYPDADGVYGVTGFYYQYNGKLHLDKLTTLRRSVTPDRLIYSLLDGNGGHFTTNAVTLRKTLFRRVGFFDEDLKLHQDTHLWFRCAVQGKLYAGEIEEAIAVRRVHPENRIPQQSGSSNALLYEKLIHSFLGIRDRSLFLIIFKRYIGTRTKYVSLRYPLALIEIIKNPRLVLKILFNG